MSERKGSSGHQHFLKPIKPTKREAEVGGALRLELPWSLVSARLWDPDFLWGKSLMFPEVLIDFCCIVGVGVLRWDSTLCGTGCP